MVQTTDRHAFIAVVALHGGVGFNDLDLNAVIDQDFQSFGTDPQSFPGGMHKMGRKFENILGTVGNTPIVRIGKLAPAEASSS